MKKLLLVFLVFLPPKRIAIAAMPVNAKVKS